MAATAAPQIDPEDVEELRIALVMNGGVSLAVWMGGVACEINRLVRKQGVYADMLGATATEARVDVVSGTSAGGINGALLALASVYDADLAVLRDIWLDVGSLDDLLRSPRDADPPSLLRGNDYFLPELRRAFAKVRSSGRSQPLDPDAVPIELSLTTTLLHGNPGTIPDDFGTVIADVNHRARFSFRRGPDVAYDSFDDARIADRLAWAARATASFPVAFEPLFYPANAPDTIGAPLQRDARNLPQSRFLLDGGILDNKPLESAVEAIYSQRAYRDVRRILAYVVPNPGASAAEGDDKEEALPTIANVALASLMELPRVESISAQIDAVVRQNAQVRRKNQNREGIMMLGRGALEELADRLFPVYRRRRLETSADYLLPEVSAGLIARTKGKQALGRRLRGWLTSLFLTMADDVPWTPTKSPLDPKASAERQSWRWGVFALENMADTMLDVLRRTLRLTAPVPEERDVRSALMALRRDAYAVFSEVRRRRANDSGFWRDQAEALVDFFAKQGTAGLNAERASLWIRDALGDWSKRFAQRGDSEATLSQLATEMARILIAAAKVYRARFPDSRNWDRAEDRSAGGTLRHSYDVLVPPDASSDDVLRNLLLIEVVLNAFGSYRDVRDQYVEMVQISADVTGAFGGLQGAREKLAGAQLANFGAFLKRSWRANDWMFGRLDGAERVTRICLNPDRLRRLYSTYAGAAGRGGAASARARIHAMAVRDVNDRADRAYLEQLWRNGLPGVDGELAFLDNPAIPIPEQLPACAAAVTRRLQLEILRGEMPVLAAAVEHDVYRGGNPRGKGADFALAMDQAARESRGRPIAPARMVQLFASCRVGQERIEQEIGSDLATSVASRAVAVVVAAGAGKHSNLGPVRKLFQVGRVPAIAFDFFAQGLITQSRTMVALFTAGLTLGAAVLVLGLVYADDIPDVVLSAGAILLSATMAVALLRYHVLASIFALTGAILVVVARGEGWLSFTGLDEEGLRWVRISAVGLSLALACFLAYVVSQGPRRQFRRPARGAAGFVAWFRDRKDAGKTP